MNALEFGNLKLNAVPRHQSFCGLPTVTYMYV